MNESEKERLIKKDIVSIENRVRHAFNQGYEMGIKESRSKIPNACGDAISRQAVLDIIDFEDKWLLDAKRHNADTGIAFSGMKSRIADLPSVSSQRRTGQWIIIDDCEQFIAKCSECGRIEDSRMINKYPYCHCGAKMQEVKK